MSDFLHAGLPLVQQDVQTKELIATPYFEDYLYDIDFRSTVFSTSVSISNVTAKNKDFIEARNGITVFAPKNPKNNTEFMVANGDGSTITVDADGLEFRFTSIDDEFIFSEMGASYHFHLFINGTEKYWRVR
jgi:hypothetical protein